MKELIELRINYDFASVLFNENEGKAIGTSVKVIQVDFDEPRLKLIPEISREIKNKYNRGFVLSWKIIRKYSKKECEDADLFHIIIQRVFDSSSDDLNTHYDLSKVCSNCGAGRELVGNLKLHSKVLPNIDISKSISGEIIVSKKFVELVNENSIRGLKFLNIETEKGYSNFKHLRAESILPISNRTIAGIDPFDSSESASSVTVSMSDKHLFEMNEEVYRCPKGHTIGLNLLSEPYVVFDKTQITQDFFESDKLVGVNRGSLKPEPIIFCSKKLKDLILFHNLKGFKFEIARNI